MRSMHPLVIMHPKTGAAAYRAQVINRVTVPRWSPAGIPLMLTLAVTPAEERPFKAAIQRGYKMNASDNLHGAYALYSPTGKPRMDWRWSRLEVSSASNPAEVDHVQISVWSGENFDLVRAPDAVDISKVIAPPRSLLQESDSRIGPQAMAWITAYGFSVPDALAPFWMSYADALALMLIKTTDAVTVSGAVPRAILLAALCRHGGPFETGVPGEFYYSRAPGAAAWLDIPYQHSELSDRRRFHGSDVDGGYSAMSPGYAIPMLLEGDRNRLEHIAASVLRCVSAQFGPETLVSEEFPPGFWTVDFHATRSFREQLTSALASD